MEEEAATLRAELADLRERAGRLQDELWRSAWNDSGRCMKCGASIDVGEHHADDCMCAPGFLDAKEGGR